MNPVGGLKVAAKRTAFGDLSNTAKNLSIVDESSAAVYLKHTTTSIQKENSLIVPAKEAFLRPAQRSSMLGNKSVSSTHQNLESHVPKVQNGRDDSRAAQPVVKQTFSRKTTTIYRDAEATKAPQIAEIASIDSLQAFSNVNLVLQPRHHKSQPQLLKPAPPVLRRTQSKQIGQLEEERKVGVIGDVTEAQYEDALEQQFPEQDYRARNPTTTEHSEYIERDYPEYHELEGLLEENLEAVAQRPQAAEAYAAPQAVTRGTVAEPRELTAPAMSEPEECWDDDDGQSGYDDPGYTTAHSYRSRMADITTVAFPLMSSRDQQELEAAQLWVDSRRTEDDLEEEHWDVSMVAEYGEEIFSYMKELEVCR
jgi:G2/mitotic-specific cyclin 3/4